jgi:hypothetical protein
MKTVRYWAGGSIKMDRGNAFKKLSLHFMIEQMHSKKLHFISTDRVDLATDPIFDQPLSVKQ